MKTLQKSCDVIVFFFVKENELKYILNPLYTLENTCQLFPIPLNLPKMAKEL